MPWEIYSAVDFGYFTVFLLITQKLTSSWLYKYVSNRKNLKVILKTPVTKFIN